MEITCPSCAQPASGRFCAHCGVAVDAACRACGNPLPAGARFCNECGATAAAPAPSEAPAPARSSVLPWAVAGVALVALAAVLVVPRLGGAESEAAPVAVAAAPAEIPTGNARAVDLASMTPREAADRLFNRVMGSISSGDSAQATQFLPMAIAAYGRVPELDADGRYHLAVLHLAAGDEAAASAEADTIRAADPDHLFGLYVAARAARDSGDKAAAREAYRAFLDRYDAQMARSLPEYRDHAQAMPGMQQEAERFIASGE